ncbi:MAG: SMC-Scp complex subunit ScpB [Nitriliruptoraceae bacterium]
MTKSKRESADSTMASLDETATTGAALPTVGSLPPAEALAHLGNDGRQAIEALLFLADEPVAVDTIADAIEADPHVVAGALTALQARYEEERRGMEIRHAAGGWRMYSAPAARPALERWALTGRTGRLTQAALETLAVIAYKQPISRQDIGEIRGVSADGAVRSLVARGLVMEVGRDEGPGQAVLYGTTAALLERLGLDSLDELPPLTDYLPDAPAPDEPELGALKEIRKRLAAAGGREDQPDPGGDLDAMPAPQIRTPRSIGDMDVLTDRLEVAARSAMSRLRRAMDPDGDDDNDVQLDDHATSALDPDDTDRDEPTGHPRVRGVTTEPDGPYDVEGDDDA